MPIAKKTPRDTRSLIVNTALRLFSERGIFNTSVQDIKRSANISIGSIYHYFPSKDAIVRALYDDLLYKMQGLIEAIMQQHETAHDRCREVVRQLFLMTEYDPDAVRFVLQGRHLEFLPNEQPVCSSRPFELMKDMVRQGIEKNEIQGQDDTLVAACLFGGPLRMISLRLDGMLDRPLPEQLDEVWRYTWRAVSRGES